MRKKIAAFLAAALLAGTVCPAWAAAAEQAPAVTFKPSDVVTDVSVQDGTEGKTPVEAIVELSGAPVLSAPEGERSVRRADIAAEQDALLEQIAELTGGAPLFHDGQRRGGDRAL